MGIAFTDKQQQVIDLHGENILVSAAAGSGKTAVLVERIIKMISEGEHPADIDRLLIVTFTNAAAAEMRERIGKAIADRLEQYPENSHLQRQSALLHNAQITTIDSFCLYVIRNHFQEINLDPSFRVADEGEINLLKQDTLQALLEEEYGKNRASFTHFVECYCPGKRESLLEENILDLHRFAMSYPWPEKWLQSRGEDYRVESEAELENASFIVYCKQYLESMLPECMAQLLFCKKLCEQPSGSYMYGQNIENTIQQLEKVLEAKSYKQYRERLFGVTFERLPAKKDDTVDATKKELAKKIRDDVKAKLAKLKEKFFSDDPESLLQQCKEAKPVVDELIYLTLRFTEMFQQEKRNRNIIDFSDMEHLALQILCKEKEGKIIPSDAALEMRASFVEIMVDEYQDSNLVQETLLSVLSKEEENIYNRFMVGDVKQSIYKFRLARPELFMGKYDTYDTAKGPKRRIDLHQNFRSREEVLDTVNCIFRQLMKKDLGGIDYDDEASLHLGASYQKPEGDLSYASEFILVKPEEGEESNAKQEATVISARIKKLLQETKVTDKKTGELRPACFGDIVILLRSGAGYDEEFRSVFEKENIPCFIESKSGYFQTKEIALLMQVLRVLDNPLQDIPLYGVAISCFGGFDEKEIAEISQMCKDERYLYQKIKKAQKLNEKLTYANKCDDFMAWIERMRKKASYYSISELLYEILEDRNYVEYVSARVGGVQRRANVQMLLQKASDFEKTSFKGLYHFIRYIEQIEKYSVEYGEASVLDENADVVRIMTIHKSKGLEFPICFVAGMGKKINRMDILKAVLTDMDMGIGIDLINPEKRTKQKTLRKQLLARKVVLDTQAEELRILYVALTRAKEKLILTGVCPDLHKMVEKHMQVLQSNEEVLPYSVRTDLNSYSEMIFAALCRSAQMQKLLQDNQIECTSQKGIDVHVLCQYIGVSDLEGEHLEEELKQYFDIESFKTKLKTHVIDEKMQEDLQDRFSYQYPHNNLQKLYTKTSVSELKMAAIHGLEKTLEEENDGEVKLFAAKEMQPYYPSFVEQEEKVSGTTRGSAMHRIAELIDYKATYDEETLKKYIEDLVVQKKLSKEFAQAITPKKILHFLQSDLAHRMGKAAEREQLYKEQPFVLGLTADRLGKEFPKEEMVLIQGIIDAFFIEDDEIVLLDYKTDVIQSETQLIDRYHVQIEYYKEALERILGKKVKECILYSFYLEKEIIM